MSGDKANNASTTCPICAESTVPAGRRAGSRARGHPARSWEHEGSLRFQDDVWMRLRGAAAGFGEATPLRAAAISWNVPPRRQRRDGGLLPRHHGSRILRRRQMGISPGRGRACRRKPGAGPRHRLRARVLPRSGPAPLCSTLWKPSASTSDPRLTRPAVAKGHTVWSGDLPTAFRERAGNKRFGSRDPVPGSRSRRGSRRDSRVGEGSLGTGRRLHRLRSRCGRPGSALHQRDHRSAAALTSRRWCAKTFRAAECLGSDTASPRWRMSRFQTFSGTPICRR